MYNLMEDAATAEICRSQVWQWIGSTLEGGVRFDEERARLLCEDEQGRLREVLGEAWGERHDLASSVFVDLALAETPAEFLTLPAYEHIVVKDD